MARPVGARLARESVDALYQADRVTALRGQARLQQMSEIFLWERCLPAIRITRWIRQTASPLFAGKPGSNR
ncbi:hypothetical protein IV01_16000 [Pseudomonas syringae]|uniref:Uncharacterized protein n=1 Tax=Pseudomonas syringae TaxID=317 RepID=A0A085VFP8_PSESX|nr:hypothetical protein IV01_16000 [Pseudomonas syringae]